MRRLAQKITAMLPVMDNFERGAAAPTKIPTQGAPAGR
jgi:molecular chaperone GrpE (heat shock protein)